MSNQSPYENDPQASSDNLQGGDAPLPDEIASEGVPNASQPIDGSNDQQPYAQQQPYPYAQQQPYPYVQQQPYGQPGVNPYGVGTKSKIAAGLLGIFLGSLGIHNFYLGYTGKALTQLVLTIVGFITTIILIGFFILSAVQLWGFIEGIIILCSGPGSSFHKDGDGYELRD